MSFKSKKKYPDKLYEPGARLLCTTDSSAGGFVKNKIYISAGLCKNYYVVSILKDAKGQTRNGWHRSFFIPVITLSKAAKILYGNTIKDIL